MTDDGSSGGNAAPLVTWDWMPFEGDDDAGVVEARAAQLASQGVEALRVDRALMSETMASRILAAARSSGLQVCVAPMGEPVRTASVLSKEALRTGAAGGAHIRRPRGKRPQAAQWVEHEEWRRLQQRCNASRLRRPVAASHSSHAVIDPHVGDDAQGGAHLQTLR